jgi:hypothetical protein
VSSPATGDLTLLIKVAVDADVAITVHTRAPDDEVVSIMFGDERLTLEFYDVASLERLRDIANEAAGLLRQAIATNARPAEPTGGNLR